MYEAELKKEMLDLPSFRTTLKQFLQRFEYTSSQKRILSVICDELILPVFNKSNTCKTADLKLLCSESGTRHIMTFNFKGLESDPLQKPFLDDLNMMILEHYAAVVLSRKTDKGWIVSVQL